MDKIAIFLSNYLNISETFIYQRIINFKEFEPIVLCYGTSNLDLFPYSRIYTFGSKNAFLENFQRFIFVNFKFSKYFEEVLKSNNIKLLQVHFAPRAMEILWLSRKLKIPQVNFFHGTDLDLYIKNRRHSKKLINLINSTKASIVSCESIKRSLVDIGCSKAMIIVNYAGIDLEKFSFSIKKPKAEGEEIKLLMVGRLIWKKGFEYGIESFQLAKRTYPNLSLRIVGDGPLKNALASQSKRFRLTNSISFLGSLSPEKVQEEMKEADILLAPSIEEGIPNVIKEALACGIPVISTYAGGIPEIIDDGKNGFLVRKRDADQLAEKIKHLIKNRQIWPEFAKAGRKKVEAKFDVKKQMIELEFLYKDILGK